MPTSATSSKFPVYLLLGIIIATPASHARITRIEIERIESPTFSGASFGNVGQYEKLVGRAYGEIDPKNELNRGIVYIDKAPRNAAGWVEYSMDVSIIKPVDVSRGNRTLFYDAVNRGGRSAFDGFHISGSAANDPSSEKDAQDGFLLKRGYTLVVSGWQGDVPAGGGRFTAQFPVAVEADGKPVRKSILREFLFTKSAQTVSLGVASQGREMRPLPAVADRMAEARLLRRSGPLAQREPIPNSEWSFGMCPEGKDPAPSNTDLCYPAGFSTNYLYDLVYVAEAPLVMGIGFAATRDLVTFLRHERSAANPLVARGVTKNEDEPVRFAIGFGRSQGGRFLKDLVSKGFNLDENRRIVFDGILPLVSGSRVTDLNSEFGTPGWAPGLLLPFHIRGADEFPHTYASLTDPVTGNTGGWLARCTKQRACPKIMHLDSGTEAWGARNSLVVADAHGKGDLPVPENVRLYYFSSTQHIPDAKPRYGNCKYLSNSNSRIETIRALLVAMQAWIADSRLPPPSRFPGVSDGTLVAPARAAGFAFPAIPGVALYAGDLDHYVKDFSTLPPWIIRDKRYTVLVPQVDADGNDLGGIRSVTLQVPLGTYTGWNLRKAGMIEDEFCGNPGSFFPFAKTAAERGADPRPSLQERYGSKEAYLARVKAAADKLVSERFLLPEDAARLIEEAKKRDIGI